MRFHTSRRSQHGAVLIVSLLFLVVLTMLGVTAMTSTTFEERMAGNARDVSVAQHSAEASLRRARDTIIEVSGPRPAEGTFKQAVTDNGSCTAGLCTPRKYDQGVYGAILPEVPTNVSWTEASDVEATTKLYALSGAADRLRGVSKQSRYIIELFCLPISLGSIEGAADQCRYWRFTAVGWGKNPNTQVTVQEVYISDKR